MKSAIVLIFILRSFFLMGQTLPKQKLYESKKQLRHGNEYYQKGDFDNAMISYQKSLDQNSTYYKSLYNLGNSLFQQEKYEEAATYYEQANKLAESKENKAKTSELLGDVFKKANKLDKALDAYKNSLLKNPKDDIVREKFIAAKREKKNQKNQKDKKNNKKDKKDKNKDDKGKNKDDKDKKDKENEKKGRDDKKRDGNKKNQPNPKGSELKPNQIQQLLESLANEEQKTQKKINVKKVETRKNEKDW